MFLEIITPEEKVFEGDVISVQLPGSEGSFQILNNHAPIVSTLKKGKLVLVDTNNESKEIEVSGGVVEVNSNHIIVLAEG
ncbi:MAG: F-type H+-transporting ATPase subunit epsilon [Saprospiraceae bacterium]|jgi:F-type H+-transporting ATPase subunit epsilon